MNRGRASPEQRSTEVKQYGRELQPHERIQKETELRLRRIGQHLATNEDGKLLLQELEDAYHRKPKKGSDPYETYLNLGREEVVLFLQGLRDAAITGD